MSVYLRGRHDVLGDCVRACDHARRGTELCGAGGGGAVGIVGDDCEEGKVWLRVE